MCGVSNCAITKENAPGMKDRVSGKPTNGPEQPKEIIDVREASVQRLIYRGDPGFESECEDAAEERCFWTPDETQ